MGTLTTGGLEVAVADGRLAVVREGRIRKIVPQVDHLSFNGPYVAGRGIEILYMTERAVLALRDARLTLVEVAPGIDPRDVLALCPEGVAVADQVATMDARIFRDAPMGT
jgi:propionate CoA-transferase